MTGRWRPDLTPALVRGTAALMVAAIDGLALHLVLDPDLRVTDIKKAVLRMGRSVEVPKDEHDRRTK